MQSLRHIIVRLFLIACCSPLFAFPPTETSFPHLLNERGEIVSNSLQPAYAQYGKIVFSGQITLTGVLERSDNDEEGVYNDELRFTLIAISLCLLCMIVSLLLAMMRTRRYGSKAPKETSTIPLRQRSSSLIPSFLARFLSDCALVCY